MGHGGCQTWWPPTSHDGDETMQTIDIEQVELKLQITKHGEARLHMLVWINENKEVQCIASSNLSLGRINKLANECVAEGECWVDDIGTIEFEDYPDEN